MKNLIKQIIKESIGKENQIEKIKDIKLPSTIEGRFLNKQQAQDLQKEIEGNYTDNLTQHFKKEKDDIRMHIFNYNNPIAEKNLNGINLRITTGLIRNKRITYLLYANGKIIGEFFSVNDIKKLIKYIEDRLIKNITTIQETVTKTKVICDNCGWSWNIKDGGNDPYTCHKCGHDNNPNILNEKCWKGYTQKGMKTMFGKQYPNCVKKKKLKEQLQSNVIYLSFNYDNNEDLEEYNIDEYDVEPQTLNIAKQNNLNILRDKNLKGFLFDTSNNKIVGALWTSDDNDSFSFDIAIDKQYQGMKLSHLLIQNAIDEYNAQSDYGNFNLPMKVDVINPMLANILKTKYNFRVVKKITNDRVIMSLKKNLNEEDYNPITKSEDYSKWKRNNVTLRGIKELGKTNEVYGSFGKGLYTVPSSNKSMARQYGDVYFVVNAKPKNPKVVQNLNDAEILRQRLADKYCKENNVNYSLSFFENNTSMENEMMKLGYDGLIIKGREMVNYKPNNIKYFRTENELQNYYEEVKKNLNEEDYRGEHTAPSKDQGYASMDNLYNAYGDDIYTPNATRYYGEGYPYDNLAIAIMQSARNRPNKQIKVYRAIPDFNYELKEKIKELLKINQFYDKFNFFPIKNYIIYNLQDKYPIEKYSYNEQTRLVLSDIFKQINELKTQLNNNKITINNGDWVTTTLQYAKSHGKSHLNNKYKVISKVVPASSLYTDGNSIHEFGYNP